VAHVDVEGFVFVVGRTADQYISRGMVVHPGVAERVLLQHGGVAEVAVVGGDAGAVAFVVLEPWAGAGVERELRLLCREQLPIHARPTAIVRVPSLPKSSVGKVMRDLLRRRVANAET
jgi:acyl-coenzyme A synthetase/AMP-(fatty) acid ligase